MEGGDGVVDPLVEEAGGDLVEAGGAEEGDLFAEAGLGEEFLDGLLAFEGLGVGCGLEEVAGEAAFAGAGADGGEEAEERVFPEDVEVAIVEVAGGAEVLSGFGSGAAGLWLGAVGAGDGDLVKAAQALGARDLRLEAKVVPDEADERGEAEAEG